jgi:hypothetical protein
MMLVAFGMASKLVDLRQSGSGLPKTADPESRIGGGQR